MREKDVQQIQNINENIRTNQNKEKVTRKISITENYQLILSCESRD